MPEKSDPAGVKDLEIYLATIAEARKSGAAKLETADGDVFVVAPRYRSSNALAPFENASKLLEPPLTRAAYSDRTAWLMASLSQLAYLPYESDEGTRNALVASLADAGLVPVAFFDNPESGTQGLLVRRPGEFRILVFRGTEKDHKDIVTDLNARFYESPAGTVHKGFATAYEGVRDEIVAALQELGDAEQLFITGHSLGGALATAATQDLEEITLVAACYTFGSPRVGTAEWSDSVKTPIYRVVNGADGVPLVPGGTVIRWILTTAPHLPFLTWLEKPLEKFVSAGFVGFQHAGDLRFLQGTTESASLKIGSAASWARFRYITFEKILGAMRTLSFGSLSAGFTDHAIAHYVTKLRQIAEDRN